MKHKIFINIFLIFGIILGEETHMVPGTVSDHSYLREFLTSSPSIENPFNKSIKEFMQNDFTDLEQSPSASVKRMGKIRDKSFKKFWTKHKLQIIYSGICLGTSLTALIFHNQVEEKYEEEKKIYEKYIMATNASDCQLLWQQYEQAKEKTDDFVYLRTGFLITSGVIGAALYLSFSLEF